MEIAAIIDANRENWQRLKPVIFGLDEIENFS